MLKEIKMQGATLKEVYAMLMDDTKKVQIIKKDGKREI